MYIIFKSYIDTYIVCLFSVENINYKDIINEFIEYRYINPWYNRV